MEASLKTLVLIPVIGIFVVAALPAVTKENKDNIKSVGLFASILSFAESIRMWLAYDQHLPGFQYLTKFEWLGIGQYNLEVLFGVYGISLSFILLTALLIPICILISWDSVKKLEKQYIINILLIEVMLYGVFSVLDIVGFYILFEAILIPMFIIIGVWGSREQKITAAYYFFFYTLVGSVLMLVSLLYLYYIAGTTDYLTLLSIDIDLETQKILFLAFFASLAVKIPKWPFHVWLPQAHVEAPVAGSVLLAGVLIKLGSYGFIRFCLPILPEGSKFFAPLVFTLASIAIIYAGMTTLRQTDLKRIIAYSSVGHMGVVMLGIFSFSVLGIEGSIFLQIAHGLVSSALFICVTILYDRFHTRLVKYYRGMTITMPLFSFLFLFFTLANIGTPLTCNFVGEFTSLLAAFEVSTIGGFLGSLGMVVSAAYALFLYNRVSFGSMSKYLAADPANRDLTRKEVYCLLPLGVLAFFLGIYPNIVFSLIHTSTLSIVTLL
jgi:proton-translocating NADH-quinone oxidoreductase chain M